MLLETFLMGLCWVDAPILLIDSPRLKAGLLPLKNRSLSRTIWPSVIEVMLFGISEEDKLLDWVSTMGIAVKDPPPFSSDNLDDLSSSLL